MYKRFILVVSMSLIVCVLLVSQPSPTFPQEPIKIGVLLPFTGTAADYGPPVKEGIELRFEEANYKIAGKPIKLIFEDEAIPDIAHAKEMAKKLVEKDKIRVLIGPIYSPSAMGCAPYLKDNKVISICYVNHPMEVAKLGVRCPGTFYQSGLPMGWYAYEKLGYRKIITLGADYTAGKEEVSGTADAFRQKGGTIVQQQWFPVGTTMDFGPYLAALKEADAVAIWSWSSDLLRFIKQYKEFGIKKPLLITLSTSLKVNYLEELGEISLGIIGGAEYTAQIKNPANNKFVAAMQKRFGKIPDKDQFGAYLAASLVLAALEATKGDTSFEKLDRALRDVNLDTAIGKVSYARNGMLLIQDRFICESRKIQGKSVWEPVYTYPQVKDPRWE